MQDQQGYLLAYIHGRANLKTLILYYEGSALEKTKQIENYYGFAKGIGGKKLYQEGMEQARNIGVEVKKEEVTNIGFQEKEFKVTTSKNEYITSTVILATGTKKNKPQIKGIEELEGKGISYCAVCDGFFYRNRKVSVLGSGNYAISETNELVNMVDGITILTNGEEAPEFRADNVKINTKEIEAINGEKKVEEIEFKDGSKVKTDGIFVAQGVAGSMEFAKKLGIMTRKRQYHSKRKYGNKYQRNLCLWRLHRRLITNFKSGL